MTQNCENTQMTDKTLNYTRKGTYGYLYLRGLSTDNTIFGLKWTKNGQPSAQFGKFARKDIESETFEIADELESDTSQRVKDSDRLTTGQNSAHPD